MREVEGVYVANVTPFRDDYSLAVDDEAYVEHVSWLAEKGVRGVVPFGTNGEGPSVTLGEKMRVLEGLFEREFPIQIIPAVMQNNLPETVEMLRPGSHPRPPFSYCRAYSNRSSQGTGALSEAHSGDEPRRNRFTSQVRCPRACGGRERPSRLGRQGLRWGGGLRRGRSRWREGRAARDGG